MQFVQNVPFFSIMLCMVSGIFSAMLPGRAAKWVTAGLAAVVAALNLWLTIFMWGYGESYVYWMGHFPAPWGNELRAGVLESSLAVVFSLIMLLSVLGGNAQASTRGGPQEGQYRVRHAGSGAGRHDEHALHQRPFHRLRVH